MHASYFDKNRKIPEKCIPHEAGHYNEAKIFGSKFNDFKEVLKILAYFGEFIHNV